MIAQQVFSCQVEQKKNPIQIHKIHKLEWEEIFAIFF